MRHSFTLAATLIAMAAMTTACQTAPDTQAEKNDLERDAAMAIADFKAKDSSIESFFKTAYGYAVFPKIAKGGAIIGGAHGRGVLYEKGQAVGFCDVSQGSIGAQLGGQVYSELIFFQRKTNLDSFKTGEFAFAGQASAVAAKAGASADVDYSGGVAVFTNAGAGLMAEASIGGQNFTYEPK